MPRRCLPELTRKRTTMFRFMTLAAAATLATAASANTSAITIVGGTTAHIGYGDIDLHSATGQHRLGGRIRRAAEMICTASTSNLLPFSSPSAQCYRAAVADGVSQMRALGSR
jgi:UrcA family protein